MDLTPFILQMQEMRYVCESSWFLCVSGCFWEWYWTRADDFLLVQLALVPGDRRGYRHMIEVLLKLQHFPWMLEVKLVQPRVFKAQFAASVLWLCFVHCSAERLVWESREIRLVTMCAHAQIIVFAAAELPCSGILISSSILLQRQSVLVPLNHCIFAIGVGGQRCPHTSTHLELTSWVGIRCLVALL